MYENETVAARFYGTEYVIAGRAVDILNRLLYESPESYSWYLPSEGRLKLRFIRSYIINTYRRIN